jgi:hypothetical protein
MQASGAVAGGRSHRTSGERARWDAQRACSRARATAAGRLTARLLRAYRVVGQPEDLTSVTAGSAAVVAERIGSSGHKGVRRRAAKAAINEPEERLDSAGDGP